MPNSPKITLSRCKDNDIQKCNIASFEDTMLEVDRVCTRLIWLTYPIILYAWTSNKILPKFSDILKLI